MFYGRNYTKAHSFKLFFRRRRFVEEVFGKLTCYDVGNDISLPCMASSLEVIG